MFSISNLCILCLNYKNLKSILIEDNEGIVIQKKLKYCFPEIVDSHLDIPDYICIHCMHKLDCFYKFKQWCLQNNTNLNNYIRTLVSADETYKKLSVKLTDIKHQNNLQTLTLPMELGNNVLQPEDKEDNMARSEETEAVLNMKESQFLLDKENDIIVKEECLNDSEFDYEFLKSLKNESASSNSDNEEFYEITVYSDNSNENSSAKPEENNVTIDKVKEFLQKHALKYNLRVQTGDSDSASTITSTCDIPTEQEVNTSEPSQTESKRDPKNYFCIYCKKLVTRLARHLTRVHKNESTVQEILALPTNSKERNKIIEKVRLKGTFEYNTNDKLNKGDLIVARRSKIRNADNYLPCIKCKNFYSKTTIRNHTIKCRNYIIEHKYPRYKISEDCLNTPIHVKANDILTHDIIPNMVPDIISSIVRSDELIILFGNDLIYEKKRQPNSHVQIRQMLRATARFLEKIKSMDPEISELKNIFDPKKYKCVLAAIESLANYNPLTDEYGIPSVVVRLGSYIIKCGKLLVTDYAKEWNGEKINQVKEFLKCFDEYYRIYIQKNNVELKLKKRHATDLF